MSGPSKPAVAAVRRARSLALVVALLAGCASAPVQRAPAASESAAAPEVPQAPATAAAPPPGADIVAGAVVETFGVQVKGLRLSANGYLVDLRYRVFDPARAKALLDRKVRPVLVDETSGSRFYVPTPPIVGALRQTSRNKVIHTDRDYFMLFANPDRRLQAGSKVALYVGDQRFGNLRVEAQPATGVEAQPPAR
jgi:hypothetical protein